VKKLFFAATIVLSCIALMAESMHMETALALSKPLVIPMLALFYYFRVNRKPELPDVLLLWAFVFSWLGGISLMLTPQTPLDIALLGIPKNKYFFIAGLSSFLLTHVLLIAVFRNSRVRTAPQSLRPRPIFYLPLGLYWVAMLWLIVPALSVNPDKKQATVPVMFYATILILMGAYALSRHGRVKSDSFWRVLIGAIGFIFSDSLIGINYLVLKAPMPLAAPSIFLTYVFAMLLIADGLYRTRASSTP
jgi:uncharacterized membrane protein YhhN